MLNSREDSVWRALAGAFHEGPAQTGVTYPVAPGTSQRLAAIERRIERARATGTLRAPAALEGRINELAADVERKIAELQVKTKICTDALNDRDTEMAAELGTQIAGLRDRIATLHREFAETASRMVEDQIEAGIAAQMAQLEQHVREAAQKEARSACRGFAEEIERRIESRDRKLLEMVLALGQRCLDAAAPSTTRSASEDASQAAGQPRFYPLRRSPFIASFFAVILGLLLLHHL